MLIVCGKCQTTIRVPEEAAGRQGRCPKCGFVIDGNKAASAGRGSVLMKKDI